MFKAFFIATLLLSNVSIYAQDVELEAGLDDSLIITSVEVTKIEDEISSDPTPNIITPSVDYTLSVGDVFGEISMYLDGLIAIGKKVWPIIEAGRPVINTTGIAQAISVLPEFQSADTKREFYEMAGWAAPKAGSYRVSYKNRLNSEVVGFTYTVYFQYKGSHNGKGKYLTNLKVVASEVYTAWGFKFNAHSELIGISNVGTIDEPVASAIIQISYSSKGLINEVRNAQSFYVDGHGNMKLLKN